MKKIIFGLILFGCEIALFAQNKPQHIEIRGETLLVTNANGSTTLMPAPSNSTHWFVLSEFLIENKASDSPKRATISGKVKDRSAWLPTEQLPIFFGSELQPPRLAAITDSHGNFSFNVTLKEDGRSGELQCSAITNGVIYLGNANVFMSDSFDDKRYLKSGVVRKYSLAELLKLSNSTNNAAGIR